MWGILELFFSHEYFSFARLRNRHSDYKLMHTKGFWFKLNMRENERWNTRKMNEGRRYTVFLGFPLKLMFLSAETLLFLPRDKSVTQMYKVSYYAGDCCTLTVTLIKRVFCYFVSISSVVYIKKIEVILHYFVYLCCTDIIYIFLYTWIYKSLSKY